MDVYASSESDAKLIVANTTGTRYKLEFTHQSLLITTLLFKVAARINPDSPKAPS
jgi:hypothetical protein